MNDEAALRDELRKIEALFSGAGTADRKPPRRRGGPHPRPAAARGEAREAGRDAASACPIHGRATYSSRCAGGMACGRTAIRACAGKASSCGHPRRFLDKVLWPEFQDINAALTEYLAQVTDKVIREEVYKETGRRRRGGGAG